MSTTDPDFYQAPKFTPDPPPDLPKQRGCFFYGCLIASIMAVLFAILLGVIAFFGIRAFNQLIDQYTSTVPRDLPKVEMAPEQVKTLKDRVEAFRKAVEDGTTNEPLVLTGDDLNALIAENPDLKGVIYVKVEGNEVKGQVSLPLDKLNFSMVRGRYLNGEADFKASLADGVLIVTIEALEINGQKLPDQFLTELRKQNLAKDAYKDEKTAEMIRKLESLEIKDGKIILKVRARDDAPKDSPATKKDVPVEVVAPPNNGVPKTEPKSETKTEPAKTPDAPKTEPAKTPDAPKAEIPTPK
jgi:hypothetical protein